MNPLHNIITPKTFMALALVAALGGCSSTSNTLSTAIIDESCQQQASTMSASAESSGATAQYLTAARTLQACINHPLPGELDEQQTQQLMQLMANATLDFIKGGDITAAQQQLTRFEQQFPQQDLYLADYTSFRDTATVLLQGGALNRQQLASLNISRSLRDELQRQHYWLNH